MNTIKQRVEINEGDHIHIATRTIVIRGIVSKVVYENGQGWDIVIDPSNLSKPYRWKQWKDGGYIVKINDQYV